MEAISTRVEAISTSSKKLPLAMQNRWMFQFAKLPDHHRRAFDGCWLRFPIDLSQLDPNIYIYINIFLRISKH